VPYTFFAAKKQFIDYKINIGNPVFFIGYPSFFYDNRNISPLLRRGFIATDPLVDYYFSDTYREEFFNRHKEIIPEKINGFLMDASVFGGSSGSLVFIDQSPVSQDGMQIMLGNKVNYVIGITTYSYEDLNMNSTQKMNIGGVISSEVIRKAVDLF
jgi:hypothetical protein